MEISIKRNRRNPRKFLQFAFALSSFGCAVSSVVAQENACTVFAVPGQAQFDISMAADPSDGYAIPEDAVVGDIAFTRHPIFNKNDPRESYKIFQLADFLHIDTQERILKAQLILSSGDKVDRRLLAEASRELRTKNYLYDARVWPYRICGNVVDIEVVTREVWTISGGFSLSRSGGSEEESISLADDNFLGRGETLALSKTSSTDRDGFQVQYFDPSVRGSRYTLNLFHIDNNDGGHNEAALELPFYSLDTRVSWGTSWVEDERTIDFFDRGEEVSSFQSSSEIANIYAGFSPGWSNNATTRLFVGWNSIQEAFNPEVGEPAPVIFPVDREINYPYVIYQSIKDDYIKTSNLNLIHRIEDFNLGQTWKVSLGYASEGLGSDIERIVYSGDYREAWQWDHTLVQTEFTVSGMWQTDESDHEDVLISNSWRYYDGLDKINGTYLALDLRYSKNLAAHKQLLLGAEENLRGYPARYQDGDRSFVFSAEHRYYTNWHLFRLLRVGGAVFVDVGRAWFPGEENDGATGILANAGIGLRIASSRAQTKRVLHVDIAFPFEDQDDIDSVQVLISGKQSF